MAGGDWGTHSNDLRAFYLAYVASKLEYCAAAWYPMLTETRKGQLEVIQNMGARIITGCHPSTRIESLLQEANLYPMSVRCKTQCAVYAEKARRLPQGDGRSVKAMKPLAEGGKHKSWQQMGDDVFNELGMDVVRDVRWMTSYRSGKADPSRISIACREPMVVIPKVPPWCTRDLNSVTFNETVLGFSVSSGDDKARRFQASQETLAALGTYDTEVWSDGSVVDGVGTCAFTIYRVSSSEPIIGLLPAGNLCSSYRAEGTGIYYALEKIFSEGICWDHSSLLICTDSQSCIRALKKGPLKQSTELNSKIWSLLHSLINANPSMRIVFQFVFSHCGVVRNEFVDMLADEAMKSSAIAFAQATCPLSMDAVKARVKSGLRASWLQRLPKDSHRAKFCEGFTSFKKLGGLSRQEQVLLARLRVGELYDLGKLRGRLGEEKACRFCGECEETVYHIFSDCPNQRLSDLRVDMGITPAAVIEKGTLVSQFLTKALDIINATRRGKRPRREDESMPFEGPPATVQMIQASNNLPGGVTMIEAEASVEVVEQTGNEFVTLRRSTRVKSKRVLYVPEY